MYRLLRPLRMHRHLPLPTRLANWKLERAATCWRRCLQQPGNLWRRWSGLFAQNQHSHSSTEVVLLWIIVERRKLKILKAGHWVIGSTNFCWPMLILAPWQDLWAAEICPSWWDLRWNFQCRLQPRKQCRSLEHPPPKLSRVVGPAAATNACRLWVHGTQDAKALGPERTWHSDFLKARSFISWYISLREAIYQPRTAFSGCVVLSKLATEPLGTWYLHGSTVRWKPKSNPRYLATVCCLNCIATWQP